MSVRVPGMGLSAPPPASIDLVGSYARRHGPDAELVLWAPSEGRDATSLELQGAAGGVTAPVQLVADDQGERLVARAPRAQLSDGQWSLALLLPDGRRAKVQARLLVQGERPLVLLWGGHNRETGVAAPKAVPARKRLARTGGRLLDAALRPLPARQAVAARGALRRSARRMLR